MTLAELRIAMEAIGLTDDERYFLGRCRDGWILNGDDDRRMKARLRKRGYIHLAPKRRWRLTEHGTAILSAHIQHFEQGVLQ